MIDITIYAVENNGGMVIGVPYEKGCDNIKLPPLADGWHYEIEEGDLE